MGGGSLIRAAWSLQRAAMCSTVLRREAALLGTAGKPFSLRLPPDLTARIDACAERLRQLGLPVSRTDVARMLIARALELTSVVDAAAGIRGASQSPTPAIPRQPTLLVVEDSEDTRELLEQTFGAHGFRVFAAGSVASGLELLSVRAPVDLVVTDYALGDGDGLSMLEAAQRGGWLDGTPAILCTGHVDLTVPSRVTLLHKPVAAEVLLDTADALLRSRGLR